MSKKLTTEEFITKAKLVHGDFYNYSKTNYTKSTNKVIIICPIHGDFEQVAAYHLQGNGCQKCAQEKIHKYRGSKKEFITKAKEVHNNKYDYSKLNYEGLSHPGLIICPKHGEFEQILSLHLNGHGCPKCAKNYKLDTETFIEKAKLIHGDKYDYSAVEYNTGGSKLKIICPTHGEFLQSPYKHLFGQGCPICGGCLKSNTAEFIKKAQLIHGDKYNYNKVEYKTNKTPVEIICPEHGSFWITPHSHLAGGGCQRCVLQSQSKLWRKLKYEFPGHFLLWEYSPDWLGSKRLDICDESCKIAIEYDGVQHFKPVKYFGGEEHFNLQKKWDAEKEQLCKENGYFLFRVPYDYDNCFFEELCDKILQIIIDNTDQITEEVEDGK